MGFRNKPIDHTVVKTIRQGRRQEFTGVLVSQTANGQLGKSTNLVSQSSCSKEKGNGVLGDVTSGEPDCLSGSGIEPLPIIDYAENWTLHTHERQQIQKPEPDEQSIRSLAVPPPKCDLQRAELRRGKLFDLNDLWTKELLQAGVGELHLCLVADSAKHIEILGHGHGALQEHRLADSRLTVNDDRATLAFSSRLEHGLENFGLVVPTEKDSRETRFCWPPVYPSNGHPSDPTSFAFAP